MVWLYDRYVLPRLLNCVCAANPIMHQRRKVVPEARGRVLELGMGGGLNLPFYDPAKVESLTGLEPSEPMRRMADAKAAEVGLAVEMTAGHAEAMPFETGAFDTVLCTYTLCSVRNAAAVLAEARRVLQPSGRLLFCEHGLAPDANVVKWQRRIEPVWKHIAGGCHLTRPVTTAIEAAGFRLRTTSTMYLPNTPQWAGWNEWGAAAPA